MIFTLVVFAIVIVALFAMGRTPQSGGSKSWSADPPPGPPPRARAKQLNEAIALFKRRDPGFSRFVLLDFCALLYTRFLQARGGGDFDPLWPYVESALFTRLGRHTVDEVRDVVIGGITLDAVDPGRVDGRPRKGKAVVEFEASYRERSGETWTHRYIRERWTFTRAPGLTSPEPEAALRLGCPACGAAAELDVDGRCRYCEQVVTDGRFGWAVVEMKVLEQKVLDALQVGPGPGGDEPGTRQGTRRPDDFLARQRTFQARNPAFEMTAFVDRVRFVFLNLQRAWSDLEWEKARPYESEALFQSHRYWIERYRRDGLRNVLEDIELERVEVCNFEQDAWYEAITVRVRAVMLDYTVDGQGQVVGGNRQNPHRFTEYWTFIRSAGHDPAPSDPAQCPSCGAPMQVDQAGACAFCGTRVVSGDFDWVLALIEQDEVYTPG